MRVAVCQMPVSADPAVNLDRVRAALADAAGQDADLAVFDVVTDISNTVYFKPALEITTESIAAYDKAYPVTAAAPAK